MGGRVNLSASKERFPEVKGVASGAILSNYQRTRVENVCERLGLTSLAYLWRRPQSMLLEEMVDAGVDAVLVKVREGFSCAIEGVIRWGMMVLDTTCFDFSGI